MLNLTFPQNSLRHILCLGAHSDDIEIGCGGTLLQLLQAHPYLRVDWVVFSGNGRRAAEATASANDFLETAETKQIHLQEFRDGFFPYTGELIKGYFETLKQQISPDLIFTHYRHDLHQDHRLISDLTWNTFRDHLILEYEIPKYDGDMGTPNVFVHLNDSSYQRKVALLMTHFATQRNKDWFTEETFLALMRLRGMESRASSGYAEAFYGRKLVL